MYFWFWDIARLPLTATIEKLWTGENAEPSLRQLSVVSFSGGFNWSMQH